MMDASNHGVCLVESTHRPNSKPQPGCTNGLHPRHPKQELSTEEGTDLLLIAIVDDTAQDSERLKAQVELSLNKAKESYRIHVFDESVDFIRSQESYDIAFLDIHMDKINGLEAAHFVRKISKEIVLIFVTQMAQMAIRGYEVDAMDFIIKPSEQASIDRVLGKALKRIESQAGSFLVLKTARDTISISTNKIYYVEVYDHDLIYHTEEGEHRLRGQLNQVRKQVDERQFVLASRSHLVNLRHISSVHHDHLVVAGKMVPLSKVRRREIEQRFVNFLGENL